MLLVSVAHANTLSWSGGGGADATWGNSANWGFAGTPGNGDTLIFPASVPNLVNTNNLAGLTLNQIRFAGSGGGYNIQGNAFTLTSSILATNTTGANTIGNNITLSGTVQVAVGNGVSLALAGVLSGTGGVNKTGLGTLIYDGPGNTYTGTTLVSAGTLQFNVSGYTAFSGPLVIGDGSGAGNPTVEDLIYGEMENTGPITINLNGTLNLNNYNEPYHANTLTTNITLSGGTITTGTGTLGLSANTTLSVSNSYSDIYGNLTTGTGTLTLQGNAPYLEIFASVSGAANIVQKGSLGTFWTAANTYTGNYTANDSGIVDIVNSQALGNTNNTMTLNGQSWLAIGGNINVTNQSLTVNSTYPSGAIYAYNTSTNSWLASNFTFNVTCPVLVDTNCALNLIGPIGGPGSLTKVGSGVLTLSGSTANTYAGTTTVSNGILLLGKAYGITAVPGPLVIDSGSTVRLLNSFQIYNPSTPVTMFDSSLFDLAGFNEWVGPTTMQGAQITSGAGIFYFSGNITVNSSTVAQSLISGNASIWAGTYTITNSGHNYSPDILISADISSGGGGGQGLIKDGNGEVGLSGNNSFIGPVTINYGSLGAESSTALGNTNTPATVNSSGNLYLNGSGLDFGLKPLVLNGPGYVFGALTCRGSSAWEGNVTLNSNSTIYPFTASSLTVTGAISGAGGVIMAGTGTLTYAGTNANTYAGLTTVNGGTLLLNKSYATKAVPGNLVVSGGSSVVRLGNSFQFGSSADILVTNGGLWDISTFFDSINTLRGDGTVNFGAGGYVDIGVNGGTSEFDGPMTGVGFAPGFTVGKFGTGTFTLGGNSTFSAGAYHVYSPGRLLVNGSSPVIPAIVDSGAILGGTGSVGIITAYGNVSPGATSPGILTSSNLNLSSSGSFTVVLAGTNPGVGGYSQLIVTGTVSLASAVLSVEAAFATPPAIGQQFTIIKNNGGSPVSGTFNGLANGAQFNTGGYFLRVNYNVGASNDVVLTLVGVPGKTVTLNAVASGWYDSTGFHYFNPNYYAGQNSILSDTNLYRNFFVFNAPVSSRSIISAELIVNDYICGSPQGRETYVLYDVTNSISALEAGGSGLINIYNDLGSGRVYGIRTISTNETGERAIIPLNYGFINDLTAAAGGQIALGGAITTLAPTNGHNQFLFSFSLGDPTDAQLRVTFGTSILTNAIGQGWYTTAGSHTAANLNYFAGVLTIFDTNLYRDFFVFNVPPFPGQPVNAELWVNSFDNASPSGVNTYQLHGVSTPIPTLTNNASGATNTYADLAAGTYYGGRDAYVTESRHFIGIPLNNAFISAATNSGGSIALGGTVSSLTTASTNEYLFGNSVGPATNVQLWLGFLASPAANPSFTGGTPTYLGNNRYQLTLSSTTGTTNEIQSSFDFQNWDFISDVVMPGATATFYYTNGNFAVPYRFFRARLLP